MAAFQFPDPAVQTTVINPITGSTYQWKEPPGKWVVTVKMRDVGDIIWEGDKGPDPIGDYKLWYSTDTLELYFYFCDINDVCSWVPTSAPITLLDSLVAEVDAAGADIATVKRTLIELEDDIANIVGSLGQVTLEEVLTNGNVADQGFVLTNLENDAILVSPENARIMVGGIGPNVVPKVELRHDTGTLDTSLVALELDEDGERFDIECDEKVDNIHFRFENDVKFELNKTGDAVFNGKVKVTPASEGDEVPTFDQLNEVAGLLQIQIDQIATTAERGAWNYDDGDGVIQGKEYLLSGIQTQETLDKQKAPLTEAYNQCLADAGSDAGARSQCNRDYDDAIKALPKVGDSFKTNDWSIANQVSFSPTDLDDNLHSFSDVEVGQTIDMVCEDGSGAMVAEITSVTLGMWYEDKKLGITPIKTSGVAHGKTRVKIFTLDDTVDADILDEYVKKSGDTVTGLFKVDAPVIDKPTNSFMIMGNIQQSDGTVAKKPLLKDYKPQASANYSSSIFYYGLIDTDESILNRGYGNSNYFQFDKKNETTERVWIRPFYDDNGEQKKRGGAGTGNMLVVNQEADNGSIIRIQQKGTDLIKVEQDRSINLQNTVRVKNLPNPVDNKDAVNKKWVTDQLNTVSLGVPWAFEWKFDEPYPQSPLEKTFCGVNPVKGKNIYTFSLTPNKGYKIKANDNWTYTFNLEEAPEITWAWLDGDTVEIMAMARVEQFEFRDGSGKPHIWVSLHNGGLLPNKDNFVKGRSYGVEIAGII